MNRAPTNLIPLNRTPSRGAGGQGNQVAQCAPKEGILHMVPGRIPNPVSRTKSSAFSTSQRISSWAKFNTTSAFSMREDVALDAKHLASMPDLFALTRCFSVPHV